MSKSKEKYNIYFNQGEQYIKAASIRKTKSIVTGDIWNIFPSEIFDIQLSIKDIHFTYPSDGNYHVSIIFKDGSGMHIFSDHASLRINNATNWKNITKEEAQEMLPLATIMVPGYIPLPLADYATQKGSFFPILQGGIGRFMKPFTTISPEKDDFVIDCNNIDFKRSPNFSIYLIGVDTEPYSQGELPIDFIDKKVFFNDYPKVWVGLFYGTKV